MIQGTLAISGWDHCPGLLTPVILCYSQIFVISFYYLEARIALTICHIRMSLVRFFIFLISWLHCVACGILVPPPGTEPAPPAVEAWNPNHWTTKEVPVTCTIIDLRVFFKITHLNKLYFKTQLCHNNKWKPMLLCPMGTYTLKWICWKPKSVI